MLIHIYKKEAIIMAIVGTCPYDDCEHPHIINLPLGAYGVVNCEGCLRDFWVHHDIIEPKAWTPEDFKKTDIYRRNKDQIHKIEKQKRR